MCVCGGWGKGGEVRVGVVVVVVEGVCFLNCFERESINCLLVRTFNVITRPIICFD